MTINPNNYDGATVTLVGRAAAAAEFPAYDKSGERGFSQVRIAVGQGYKDKSSGEWVDTGTVWYTVQGRTEDLSAIGKGDKVRVDEARLEAREFDRKDGTKGQAFETKFGTVSIIESKSGGSAAEDAPF